MEPGPTAGPTIELVPFRGIGPFQNTPLPLIVMRGAIEPDPEDAAASFEGVFASNGWIPSWRSGIYSYHHYHSTAHEVLGIARGSARICFGGEGGRDIDAGVGDVLVIPAGLGHRLVSEYKRLLVVGAYAGGRSWDIVRDRSAGTEAARARVAAVSLPDADPVSGPDGSLVSAWRKAAGS